MTTRGASRDWRALAWVPTLALVGLWWMSASRPLVHTPEEMGGVPRNWPDMRIDVNRASAEELTILPGIGRAMAERLVADRETAGRFTTLADLDRVSGVGERFIDRLAPFAIVEE